MALMALWQHRRGERPDVAPAAPVTAPESKSRTCPCLARVPANYVRILPYVSQPFRPAPVLRLIVAFVVAITCAHGADAHPVPFSYLDLRVKAGVIEGDLVVHVFDAAHDLDLDPAQRLLDASVVARESRALTRILGERFHVSADGRLLSPQWSGAELLADRSSLRLPLQYSLPGRAGIVRVDALMFPYDPQHQTFL